ncbi:hypothetical protein [Marinoscillum luteum]|uniref:Uncharacterized protein n=1 Tax=Marinoscillum luteum TaxID=861051 RepID=A0ABW7NIK1_9BACT
MKKTVLIFGLALTTMTVRAQWTDNGDYMTTNDKVGIGLNPSAQFQIRAGTSTTSYFNGVAIYNNPGNAIRSSLSVTSDDNGRINLYNNATSLKVLINSYGDSYFMGGNIGIGTSSPNSPLSIGYNNASNQLAFKRADGNESFFMNINSTNQILFKNTSGGGSYDFQTNISGLGMLSALFIEGSNGNIGINSNAPSEKLDVNGNIKLNDSGNKIYWDWPNRTIEQYSSDGQSRMIRFRNSMDPGSNPDGGFDFANYDGTSVMRINNHKVAIGTTDFSGNHRLRVEGSIGAREIKVEGGPGWSDFVFKNDYKLRTLEEVEQHISEKGHLPEIPSEAEVAENGINLGEMNAKLLQKIEELTLYLIEQNKEIKELQEKVRSLEKE